jgi:hypothetical protein
MTVSTCLSLEFSKSGEVNREALKGHLQSLHTAIDNVVHSYITTQCTHLDSVAAELDNQKRQIARQEQSFNELSDSIANFVEAEAEKIKVWGVSLTDEEADARHEAYDADLPGPPVLHKINRLWRKAMRAFEAMRESKERESDHALRCEKARSEALIAAAEIRCEDLRQEHAAELDALRASLTSARDEGQHKDGEAKALEADLHSLTERHEEAESRLAEMVKQLEDAKLSQNRSAYEWDAEREELIRKRDEADLALVKAEANLEATQQRETDLIRQVADRGEKLEQMRKLMDDQEREMTMKIDRVQHYVKERQAGALNAERKQKDAEQMAEKWQREVQRLQSEKDRLTAIVIELQEEQQGKSREISGARECHQQEVTRLQESLRKTQEDMRATNSELLQQRESEHQAMMNHERQREKERSIALLKKKEQELHIKEQQLKAARQRIQELESGTPPTTAITSSNGLPSPSSSRGSSAGRGDATLPRLPQSAR